MELHSAILLIKGTITVKRGLFALNSLLLCCAVGLGGVLAAKIVENQYLIVPEQKIKYLPQQQNIGDRSRKMSDFKAIIDYNVFDAETSQEVVLAVIEPIETSTGVELNSILSNLKLLGIGLSSGDSFCIIRNIKLKTEDVFRKGDEVAYTVGESVQRSGLIVLRIVNQTGDQKVYLKLGEKTGILEYQEKTEEISGKKPVWDSTPRLKPRTSSAGPALASKSSYSVDGQNYHIESTEVDSHLNNFANLLNQARMVPHFEKGKHKGYKVKAIDKGSLYEKLGLRNNDIITEVNGEPLDSGEKVMSLFKQLRNEREFSVKVNRKGTPQVLNIFVN